MSIYDIACRDTFVGSPNGSEASNNTLEESKTPLAPFSSYSANLQPLKSRRPLDAMMDTMLLQEALLEQWQRAQQYVATHQKKYYSPERLEVLQVKNGLQTILQQKRPPTNPSILMSTIDVDQKGHETILASHDCQTF